MSGAVPSASFARRPPLVLAYHGLGVVERGLDPHNLYVPPDAFERQVNVLKRRGYEFVKLREFARRLAGGESVQGICALTFDDGSSDNATVLPPLLAELEVPATLFICPGLLGEPHPFMDPETGIKIMDRTELASVAADERIEIGAHTNTHADLGDVDAATALAEMRACRDALEQMTGSPVTAFAYPYCQYSPSCPGAAAEAGYEVAVTCGSRGDWSPYELRRESIDPLDGRLTFALKSRGVFRSLRDSGLGRVLRWLARPVRHRSA